jgi:hypothetical protein
LYQEHRRRAVAKAQEKTPERRHDRRVPVAVMPTCCLL